MASEFNTQVGINPAKGFKENRVQKILKSQFGDGYMQRTVEGLNNHSSTFSLNFVNRTPEEASVITDFLEARGGFRSFTWTPPGRDKEIKVFCDKWSETYVGHSTISIEATFTKVYE